MQTKYGGRKSREVSADHSTTSPTTPAPTVRPPSRMAKRSPGSIATAEALESEIAQRLLMGKGRRMCRACQCCIRRHK